MPPSKRKSVRRKAVEATVQDLSDIDMPDSSPTAKPSAKKRRMNGTRSARKDQTPSPEPVTQGADGESEEDSEPVSTTDLLDSVISYLSTSKETVAVAKEHANEGVGTEKVEAYAKIAGKDWTYYVHDQTVNIGRPPDDRQLPSVPPGASSPVQDLKDQFPVHIDLGPSKIVSRHHASISYDGDHADGGGWFVRVNGRNGVRVNNQLLKRGSKLQIQSGTVLEIASTQMMFVLPNEKVVIDQIFIDRAKALATGEDLGLVSDRDTEPEKPLKSDVSLPSGPGYPNLAPAPPDFRRTTTPPPSDGRNQRGVFDSKSTLSPIYGRGMMLESTQEIDYSRDSAKDLKPPYSYAHMIAQAIFSSEEEKLTLSNIYSFIADRYAFYRHSNSGWQNSIRHNLSLNKAFQKVPRRTDEPGKGMKWQIAPEYRQEYLKKMQRRSGASSNPSSPAAAKEVNPNFRGPNGQNLGYDTSMVTSFSARDPNASQKLNMSFPPYPPAGQPYTLQGPPGSSQPLPNPHSTPQRSRANTSNTLPDNGLDDSPLPPQYPGPRAGGPYYAMPTSSVAPHLSPTNPTLSSSFLETPFHPSQHSMVTPAPLRQNPRLAPPSTLVAPSKFMPESSPAGPGLFWKGFLGGMTPGPPGSALPPDMSPVKAGSPIRGRKSDLEERDIMSSSPPPPDGGLSGSPSKPARGRANTSTAPPVRTEEGNVEKRSVSTDPSSAIPSVKSNGVSSAMNEGNSNMRLSVGPGSAPSLSMSRNPPPAGKQEHKEDEDDDGDGFDLARGFAPIGSFSSQRSGGVKS